MQAHLVQFDIAWENKVANYARVRQLLSDATIHAGDLIVLPEMFDTGFSFEIERTADTDHASAHFLADLARSYRSTIYATCTAIGPDDRARNRALIYAPDATLIAQYDKIHPFSIGRESERFSGGREIVTCEWRGDGDSLQLTPAICYDLRFPELFRAALSRGAEVFVIGANWPTARVAHWRALLIARAIENQAFVLGVNRTGRDPGLEYSGNSLIVGPQGEVVAEADARECVLSAPIALDDLRRWRAKFPAWRDRLPLDLWDREARSGR